MSEFILCTDLHHGADLPPRKEGEVKTLGKKFALPMQRALNKIATVNNISIKVDNGDKQTFDPDPMVHLIRSFEAYYTSSFFPGDNIDVNGNHELDSLLGKLDSAKNGFNAVAASQGFNLFVCQPQLDIELTPKGKFKLYQYPTNLFKGIGHRPIPDAGLILVGHFSFDRHNKGYPMIPSRETSSYGYQENREGLSAYAKEIIGRSLRENPNDNNVIEFNNLSLHGHGHRFNIWEHENFTSLTIPSTVQEDPLNEGQPSGIFCIVKKDDLTHRHSVAFKQIKLNPKNLDEFEVHDISIHALQEHYYRPYKHQTSEQTSTRSGAIQNFLQRFG